MVSSLGYESVSSDQDSRDSDDQLADEISGLPFDLQAIPDSLSHNDPVSQGDLMLYLHANHAIHESFIAEFHQIPPSTISLATLRLQYDRKLKSRAAKSLYHRQQITLDPDSTYQPNDPKLYYVVPSTTLISPWPSLGTSDWMHYFQMIMCCMTPTGSFY